MVTWRPGFPSPLGDTHHSETVLVCGHCKPISVYQNDGSPETVLVCGYNRHVRALVFWHDDGPEWVLDQDEGELPDEVVGWRPLK